MDMQKIAAGLKLGDDGIWYAADSEELSYPSDGNDACFAIEDNSFWFRHRNNCIASVVSLFPPEENGTLFDIGGGNGFVSSGLVSAGFDVALVEPGRSGAFNAKKRGVENVICATTTTAQFNKNSLPAVGLFDVVEHIEDDLGFLRSVRVLMKPGGRLYVTVPAYGFLWSPEDVSAGHFRRYDMSGISQVLQQAGFEVEFSSYIFRFLPVPVFLLRALPHKLGLSRESGSPEAASRDHAVKGGVMIDILESMLKSEIGNLDRKRPMRFGGSCLIVARRP